MKTNIHFWSYLTQLFLELETFQIKAIDKTKTHIVHSVTLFFFENRAIYEIIRRNNVEPDRPQMTLWCMRIG